MTQARPPDRSSGRTASGLFVDFDISSLESELTSAVNEINTFIADIPNVVDDVENVCTDALEAIADFGTAVGTQVAAAVNDIDFLGTFGILPLCLNVAACVGNAASDSDRISVDSSGAVSVVLYEESFFEDTAQIYVAIQDVTVYACVTKFTPTGMDASEIANVITTLVSEMLSTVTSAASSIGLLQASAREHRAPALVQRSLARAARRAASVRDSVEARVRLGSCTNGWECVTEIQQEVSDAYTAVNGALQDVASVASDAVDAATEFSDDVVQADIFANIQSALPTFDDLFTALLNGADTLGDSFAALAPDGFEMELSLEVIASFTAEAAFKYAYEADGLGLIEKELDGLASTVMAKIRNFHISESFKIPNTPFDLRIEVNGGLEMPIKLLAEATCSLDITLEWLGTLGIVIDDSGLTVNDGSEDPSINVVPDCSGQASASIGVVLRELTVDASLCLQGPGDNPVCATLDVDMSQEFFMSSVEIFYYDGSGSYTSPTTGNTMSFSTSLANEYALAYNVYSKAPALEVKTAYTLPALDLSSCALSSAVGGHVVYSDTDPDALWEITDIVGFSASWSAHDHVPHTHTPHDHAPHTHQPHVHSPHTHTPHSHATASATATEVAADFEFDAPEGANLLSECAVEGEICECLGLVYFGADTRFVTKFSSSSEGYVCSVGVFGTDPAEDAEKACYCKAFTFCADEGGDCTCTGTAFIGEPAAGSDGEIEAAEGVHVFGSIPCTLPGFGQNGMRVEISVGAYESTAGDEITVALDSAPSACAVESGSLVYRVYNNGLTFDRAQTLCKGYGGTLAEPRSQTAATRIASEVAASSTSLTHWMGAKFYSDLYDTCYDSTLAAEACIKWTSDYYSISDTQYSNWFSDPASIAGTNLAMNMPLPLASPSTLLSDATSTGAAVCQFSYQWEYEAMGYASSLRDAEALCKGSQLAEPRNLVQQEMMINAVLAQDARFIGGIWLPGVKNADIETISDNDEDFWFWSSDSRQIKAFYSNWLSVSKDDDSLVLLSTGDWFTFTASGKESYYTVCQKGPVRWNDDQTLYSEYNIAIESTGVTVKTDGGTDLETTWGENLVLSCEVSEEKSCYCQQYGLVASKREGYECRGTVLSGTTSEDTSFVDIVSETVEGTSSCSEERCYCESNVFCADAKGSCGCYGAVSYVSSESDTFETAYAAGTVTCDKNTFANYDETGACYCQAYDHCAGHGETCDCIGKVIMGRGTAFVEGTFSAKTDSSCSVENVDVFGETAIIDLEILGAGADPDLFECYCMPS